jgi:hypothetical protein
LGPAPVQQRDDHGHDHGSAAHEHARDGWFGRAFRGEDGQIEADHADAGEQRQTEPVAERKRPQAGRRSRPGQRDEQDEGQAVAQKLAARVRVVAEDAVGGEGPSDEDAGERGEESSTRGGGVHARDAREDSGPV